MLRKLLAGLWAYAGGISEFRSGRKRSHAEHERRFHVVIGRRSFAEQSPQVATNALDIHIKRNIQNEADVSIPDGGHVPSVQEHVTRNCADVIAVDKYVAVYPGFGWKIDLRIAQ